MITIHVTGGTVNMHCHNDRAHIKEALSMANDALVKLQAAADKLDASVTEVASEVADIKSQVGNSAEDQAKLSAIADRVAAAAQKLSDINPDAAVPADEPVVDPVVPAPSEVPADPTA